MQDILKRKESYNHSPTVFSGKGIHVEKQLHQHCNQIICLFIVELFTDDLSFLISEVAIL